MKCQPWILIRFFLIHAYLFIGSFIVEGHPISIMQENKNVEYVVNLTGYIVLICVGMILFLKTHTSSPGFVVEKGKEDIELQKDQDDVDPKRFCTKCQHIRPPRSKHCNDCQHCIIKFGKLSFERELKLIFFFKKKIIIVHFLESGMPLLI